MKCGNEGRCEGTKVSRNEVVKEGRCEGRKEGVKKERCERNYVGRNV